MNEKKDYSLSGVYNDFFNKDYKKNYFDKKISSKNTKDLIEEIDTLTKSFKDSINLNDSTIENPTPTDKPSLKTNESDASNPDKTAEEVKNQINKLIGLSTIKNDIETLVNFINVQKLREAAGLPNNDISLHTAFIGNPGTGKTTIARLIGQYFKAIGVLEKGHVVEVSRADLVAEHVGGTAVKTNKIIDSALDGILFIDEAYSLANESSTDYGKEAVNIIVDRMEKDRHRLAIFFAGYDEEMETFFNLNSGLASRVTRKFYFDDYSGEELFKIFELIANKNQYILSDSAAELMIAYFNYVYYIRDNNFGNGRLVRNSFEKLIKQQAHRVSKLTEINRSTLMTITEEDVRKTLDMSKIIADEDSLEQIMSELNQYVGLDSIKEHILNLISLVKANKMRTDMNLPVKQITYHSIFSGSPGTGKTTIARVLGEIYCSLGILKKGHVIEIDRSGLIGSYVGQTEVKTTEVIDEALDGILFIDEAYSLVGGHNDYGQIAIDTLLKRMDDDRERLIVIVAGYTNEMESFIRTNPGLKDRFTQKFVFEDYTFEELYDIFKIFAYNQQYIIAEQAKDRLLEYLENKLITNPKNFGNGRFVRNLFEKVIIQQAGRISQLSNATKEDVTTILVEDINKAIKVSTN